MPYFTFASLCCPMLHDRPLLGRLALGQDTNRQYRASLEKNGRLLKRACASDRSDKTYLDESPRSGCNRSKSRGTCLYCTYIHTIPMCNRDSRGDELA